MMGSDGREVYWATTVEYEGRLSTQVTDDPRTDALIMLAAIQATSDLDMDDVKITQWCHHGHGPDEPCTEAPIDISEIKHCNGRCAYYDLLKAVNLR